MIPGSMARCVFFDVTYPNKKHQVLDPCHPNEPSQNQVHFNQDEPYDVWKLFWVKITPLSPVRYLFKY